MTKTRSGDEEDNQNIDDYRVIDYNWGFSTGTLRHVPNLVTVVSDVDEHALMFANLGEEYKKCSDRRLEAWGEVTKMYRIKEGWSSSVNILDKSLAHLMFNT